MNRTYSSKFIAEKIGQDLPTEEQELIIEAPLAPAVVIAGAGSGKTETMSSRLVYLVANGQVRPDQVLGLTFTKKAATELSHRIRRRLLSLNRAGLIPELSGEISISTYHSYAGRILGEHGLRIGVEPPSQLAGAARTWLLADRIVNKYDGPMSVTDSTPSSVTGYVIDLANEIAEHGRTIEQVTDFTKFLIDSLEAIEATDRHGMRASVEKILDRQRSRLELLPLVSVFTEAKLAEGELSFDDQMSLAAQIAEQVPSVGELERSRYQVVLLDEYQDTSQSQLLLMKSLFGHGHPVTAVGDPFQSIYGWRGASAQTLEHFPVAFPDLEGKPAKVYPLMVSWRNDESILAAANAVSLSIRTISDKSLLPSPKAKKGELLCGLYSTIEEEASAIGEFIAGRWLTGVNTCAVLVRTRNQIPLIESALRGRNIPVEVVGVGGLLLTPEVSDLRATLEVLVNPEAGNSLMRILTGARWRIGPRDLMSLSRYSSSLVKPSEANEDRDQEEDVRSIVDALDQINQAPREIFSVSGYERLSRLSRELARLRRNLGAPLPDLILDVEFSLGLDSEVSSLQQTNHSRTHLDRFLEEAVNFGQGGGGSAILRSFLSYLETASQTERGLKPGEVEVSTTAVQILTIHGAKGLEWDVVAVAGLTNGTFPSKDRGDDNWLRRAAVLPFPLRGDNDALPEFGYRQAATQAELEKICEAFAADCAVHSEREEIRLGYVALTRAKHSLFCSSAWWGNGKKPTGPSQLFDAVRAVAEISGEIASDEKAPTDKDNPLLVETDGISWPLDPLGERRKNVEHAARLVENSMDSLAMPVPLNLEQESLLSDAKTLLKEFAERERGLDEVVLLPPRLSVSALIELYEDQEKLAKQIRRPLPSEPNQLARRGTAFHRWLEKQFGSVALIDVDELPGSADSSDGENEDLDSLQSAWNSSVWAQRSPIEVEVPFETKIDAILLRGRIDAIYQNSDGSYEVVDWKTGAPKQGEAAESAALQLAAYRLAWALIKGIDPSQVSAAFHYVPANLTVRPADLKSKDELIALIANLPRLHS